VVGGSGLLVTSRGLHGGGLREDSCSRFLGSGSLLSGGEFSELLDGGSDSSGNLALALGALSGSSDDLGLSSGSGSGLDLLESISSLLLLEDGVHICGGGLSLLEGPGVEVLSGLERNDVLSDVGLGSELGDVEHGLFGSSGDSGSNALVGVVLDEGLHLVVSEEVDWVSGEGGLFLLLGDGLEALDDKSDFESTVGGEDVGGVDLVHLEGPVADDDDSGSEVGDVEVGELGVELVNSLLGEVAGDVEEAVGDEEVGEGLLDVALDGLLGDGAISSVSEHVRVELLESGNFGHFDLVF